MQCVTSCIISRRMKTYLLLLGLLLYNTRYGQLQGVTLQLRGQIYPNNSLVCVEGIGENTSAPGALKCINTNIDCGTDLISESCNRTWNYPNRTSVPDFNSTQNDSLYVTRDKHSLLLNRPNETVVPTGIYYCELPNNNTIQQLYVGIYDMTGGTVSIDSLVYDKASQSIVIVCTSSGGPTTSVSWSKDGGAPLSSSAKYTLSQFILDTISATYRNKLTIWNKTDSDTGTYECTVGNTRNSSTRTVTIEVCEEDSLRLWEDADSLRVSAQICVQDIWQNIVLSDTSQTLDEDNSNTLMLATPRVTAGSLTIEWNNTEQLNAGSTYEVMCTSSSGDETQSVTLTITDSQQTQATFDGLLPNTTYSCCVSIVRNTTGSVNTYIASTCGTVQTVPEAVLSIIEIALIAVAAGLLVLLLLVTITLCCALLKRRNKRTKSTQGRERTIIEDVVEGGEDDIQLLNFKDKRTTDQTTNENDMSPVFANTNATFDKEEELPNVTPTSKEKYIPQSGNVHSDQPVSKEGKATPTSSKKDIPTRNTAVKAKPAAKEKPTISTPLQERARDTVVKAKPAAKKEKARVSTPLQERARDTAVKAKPAAKEKPTISTPLQERASIPVVTADNRVPTQEPDEQTPISEPIYSEANVDPRATSEEAGNPLYGSTSVKVADEAENPMYGEVRRN